MTIMTNSMFTMMKAATLEKESNEGTSFVPSAIELKYLFHFHATERNGSAKPLRLQSQVLFVVSFVQVNLEMG